MSQQHPHVVVIGGGTGTFTVLSALRRHAPPVQLSAIVAMADDGGSTGVLRDEMGVLPPGSVRPALIALSRAPEEMRSLFMHRFEHGTLAGHNVGNLILTALDQAHGDFDKGLEVAARILNIAGEVVPSTLDDVRLVAELENGDIVRGEAAIDRPEDPRRSRIVRVWLEPHAVINRRTAAVLDDADMVVVGPGDLYTSVIPNFLVDGMQQALRSLSVPVVYVCNVMNKAGETRGFQASDFIREVEHYAGRSVDGVVVNTQSPDQKLVARYAALGATPVTPDVKHAVFARKRVVGRNLLATKTLVRHNQQELASALMTFLS